MKFALRVHACNLDEMVESGSLRKFSRDRQHSRIRLMENNAE